MVKTETLTVDTAGDCQVLDLTESVAAALTRSGLRNGTMTVFNVGSTAAITTTEFEPGLATCDLAAACERLAPAAGRYLHEETWHDDNGHAHVRASLLGPSLSVPVLDGALALGTWQQIVLIEFDTRPRRRRVICQMVGE